MVGERTQTQRAHTGTDNDSRARHHRVVVPSLPCRQHGHGFFMAARRGIRRRRRRERRRGGRRVSDRLGRGFTWRSRVVGWGTARVGGARGPPAWRGAAHQGETGPRPTATDAGVVAWVRCGGRGSTAFGGVGCGANVRSALPAVLTFCSFPRQQPCLTSNQEKESHGEVP